MSRFAVLIDGGYLDKVCERQCARQRVDLGKLPEASRLRAGLDPIAQLFRAYYYHCPVFVGDPPTDEQRARQRRQDKYFAAIESLPRFEVRLGRLRSRGLDSSGKPIFEQKRADVLLAIDCTLLSVRRDVTDIVLLAGDSDFVPVVKVAKEAGVIVHLVHSRDDAQYAHDLWKECDDRIVLDAAFMDAIRR